MESYNISQKLVSICSTFFKSEKIITYCVMFLKGSKTTANEAIVPDLQPFVSLQIKTKKEEKQSKEKLH